MNGAADHRVLGIKSGLADVGIPDIGSPASPLRAGDLSGHVFGQAQGFAGVTDGAAWAITDDGCRDTCAMTAILLVDVLNNLLAPFVLEIDVDVRWLLALC